MFKTLDDLKKEQKGKKQTTSYTGGEKSGLAVENPNDINGIIQQAEQNSKNKEENEKDNQDSGKKTNCKITLYQNGFQIDDGEFRDYNSQQNKQFMAELNQGNVPQELKSKYPKGLYVGIDDKRDQQFIPPPPPKYIEFSGQGVSLSGSNVPKQQVITKDINLNAGYIKVNPNQPTTEIQIRLHNGQSNQVTINTTDTVSNLYSYVQSIAPVNGGQFQLVAGFPPKPLLIRTQTIEEADLLNARITQKI